jgi:hypothetical protein
MLKRAMLDGQFVAPHVFGPNLMLGDSEACHAER